MDPTIHQGEHPIAEGYRLFAEREARHISAVYADWATQVATDHHVLDRLAQLPRGKRQPNLVFAAARWHGAGEDYDSFRTVFLQRWPQVHQTILARATQTNEAARCATLLPFLAQLPQPVALLEVGAAAGLCLLPDHYSYRYDDGTHLDPASGVSPLVIETHLDPRVPAPALPQVAWRAGIDLNPIDASDEDAGAWLETLVWPGQEERRRRLRAALQIARRERPRIVAGDLVDVLPEVAAQAPPDATLVVFHTAVLAYLDAAARDRFTATVKNLPGHWISNEGQGVLPGIWEPVHDDGLFLLAVDGIPRALTNPHGKAVHALRK